MKTARGPPKNVLVVNKNIRKNQEENMMKSLLAALSALLVVLIVACTTPTPSATPMTDPFRQELELGKVKKITFPCANNVTVTVEVVFNRITKPGYADVNGLEVVSGYMLHVQPKECAEFYTVGWIEVQGNRVFLHLLRPAPMTPPFKTQ